MIIIVTGASQGLGKAIAQTFAKQGNHTLLLNARNQNNLLFLQSEWQLLYPNCHIEVFAANLSIQAEAVDFGNWCLGFGTPNILVNNAGQFLPGSIYNEAAGTLEHLINTNLYSAYHLTRILLPSMIKAQTGHIFNICSIASIQAYANGGSYSISKFALLGFSKNLREELKPHHIKVTSVLPGAAYTNSWAGSGVNPSRIMEANDIAEMVYASSQLSAQACVEEILLRPQLGDL
jgi:short-subunit dehydrogenase